MTDANAGCRNIIILGIHEGHNASAALLIDGKIVACASEERFSRLKNDQGHPAKAIDSVLTASNVSPEQIDMVAIVTKTLDPMRTMIKRDALFGIEDYVREQNQYWRQKLYEGIETDFWKLTQEEPRFKNTKLPYNFEFINTIPENGWGEAFNEERIRVVSERLNVSKDKIRFIDHHTGHAYYAYFASPRFHDQKAAIVTADSWGDGCNATISIAENNRVTEIHRTTMCNIARIYRFMTLLLGMRPSEHEYKVMGLAPYARDYIREPAYRIFKETLAVDGLDFKWNQQPQDMYFHFRDRFEGLRFDGIAAGLQLWLEDLVSEWITNIMTHTGTDVIYYSGGLSMNVKANKVIAELPCVRDFYVPPSGADESLSMGAAYVLSVEMGDEPSPLGNAYLGYEPSAEESKDMTDVFINDPNYNVIQNPSLDLISELLVKGKVLARCVGKMEFGARSLGNRSILCDPSKYENIRIINEKIKFRDFWMPFTPTILHERADDYIVNPKGIQATYMTITFESTPLARQQLKAAIHPYDFTVRPQLITPEMNADYYALVKAFEAKTGIGAVLNTSLNMHGQPIVCTAADAVDTLIKSGLDGLILPGILLLKPDKAIIHNIITKPGSDKP